MHAQAIRELVARDKNHPSVVLWSIANEPESDTPEAEDYFRPLFDVAREADPTRPVGFVNVMLAPHGKCRVSQFADVLMLNRYYGWYTHTGELDNAEVALRGGAPRLGGRGQADHHHRVRRRHPARAARLTAQPWTEEYQVDYLDMNHRVFDRIDAVVGEHVWNFADFATTPGIMRVGGNKKGVFTRDRNPKAAAFALRRRWRRRGRADVVRGYGRTDGRTMRAEISFGADRAAVDRVTGQLAGVGRLGVAFSGGVDSATLLALAVRALGPGQVVALLGVSPSLAADERAAAHDVARFVGVPVVEVETREGDRPEYRANGPDRCFHCKDELFTTIGAEVLDRHGLDRIAYGENADDTRRPDRPGAQAATGTACCGRSRTPGSTRPPSGASRGCSGLPCADKPAAPCLASRIPHHEPVTPAKLAQVEAAERALRALGFTDCRVRHHGDVARDRAAGRGDRPRGRRPARRRAAARSSPAGFRFVAVDLAGIQSGAFTLPLVTVGRELTAPPRRRCWPGSRTSTSTAPAAAATRRPSTARARRPSRSG